MFLDSNLSMTLPVPVAITWTSVYLGAEWWVHRCPGVCCPRNRPVPHLDVQGSVAACDPRSGQLCSVVLCPVLFKSLQPHGLQPAKLLCPWNFSGKNNAGAGCHFLLQGIFLTQRLNPHLLHLLHWQVDTPPGKPSRERNADMDWVRPQRPGPTTEGAMKGLFSHFKSRK